MREIKFRAWDIQRKEWVHKQACSILGETILLCGWMQRPNGHHVRLEELNDIEVLQYTGLKDKKGKEVYEGDILKGGIWLAYEVRWEDCGFNVHSHCKHNFEVIGNIYENSELLK